VRYTERIKEMYEFVGDDGDVIEFNRINPYQKARDDIKNKYPNATVKRVKTEYISLPNQKNDSKFAPYLCIWFETGEVKN